MFPARPSKIYFHGGRSSTLLTSNHLNTSCLALRIFSSACRLAEWGHKWVSFYSAYSQWSDTSALTWCSKSQLIDSIELQPSGWLGGKAATLWIRNLHSRRSLWLPYLIQAWFAHNLVWCGCSERSTFCCWYLSWMRVHSKWSIEIYKWQTSRCAVASEWVYHGIAWLFSRCSCRRRFLN